MVTFGLFEFEQSEGVLADGFALGVEQVEVWEICRLQTLLLLQQILQVGNLRSEFALYSGVTACSLIPVVIVEFSLQLDYPFPVGVVPPDLLVQLRNH